MNARQTKKFLKKQINKLQSDNDLMRKIIVDSPRMQELYNAYTKPLNVRCTTMQFQKFMTRGMIPDFMREADGMIEIVKRAAAKELCECIKDYITYEVDTECMTPAITASIYVGRK